MILAVSLQDNWKLYAVVAGVGIAVIILLAVFINKGKYQARFTAFYKRLDKAVTKKYNGNILIESLLNAYVTDDTNTFKSLKAKGKRKVKSFFEYYVKNLPELVMYKSFISPDKNKNQLAIMLLDEYDKLLFKWDKSKKVKGLIKASNKYQMLTPIIAYLSELPLNIKEGAPYRFVNHDNDYRITYEIVKNVKQLKKKQKEKKLSKAQIKALAKVEKVKAKKVAKAGR
jgi:hypothetical protein